MKSRFTPTIIAHTLSAVTVIVVGACMLYSPAVLAQSQPAADSPASEEAAEMEQEEQQMGPTIADGVCKGVLSAEGDFNPNATVSDCNETEDNNFGGLVRKIINIFSVVVGAVSVIMIIIGGFRYIISGGDSSGVQAAKNTILYAIVGLVIVLFAQIIVRFVLTSLTPATNG